MHGTIEIALERIPARYRCEFATSKMPQIRTMCVMSLILSISFPLKEGNSNICQGHSIVWGHMVGGSKIKIKPEHVVYRFMGMSRIIYKIIKYFNLLYLLFYYIMLYCMEIQQLIFNTDS